jgi:hypothetical protein
VDPEWSHHHHEHLQDFHARDIHTDTVAFAQFKDGMEPGRWTYAVKNLAARATSTRLSRPLPAASRTR